MRFRRDAGEERETATECAYKGGATAVDSDLKILNAPEYYQP